jgi:hypothetical protein
LNTIVEEGIVAYIFTVKIKLFLEQTMKGQKGSISIALLFL